MGASGTNSLNFRANLDISDAKKNARELLKIYKDLKIESSSITSGPGTNSSQGISAYRQAQLEMQKALRDSRLETERLKQEQARLRAELEQGRVAQQANRTEVERLRASEQALRVELQQGRITQQQFNAQLAQGRIAQQGLNAQLVQGRVDAQNARAALAELTLQQRRQSIAAREARDSQRAASGSYKEAQQRLRELGLQIRSVSGGFQSQSPLMKARIAEYNRLNQALKDFDARLGNHQRNVGNYSGALQGSVAGLLSMAAGYISAGQALSFFYDKTLAFERIQAPLTFILGSEGDANVKLKELKELANELGLEYFTLATSYKSFTAAALASNFPMKEAEKIFISVSKAAAVLKLSDEQLSGSLLALQQMISKGNVQAEELRGQLAERLPGAFALAAKAMGVTEIELNKLLKNGEVLASELLPKLALQLDKRYGDKAADGIKGLNSEVGQLNTALQSLGGEGSALNENLFQPIIRGARMVVNELGKLFRGSAWENIQYLFTFSNDALKNKDRAYDLRDQFKNSKSALSGSMDREYSKMDLGELRNYYNQLQKNVEAANKSYQDFAKGIKDGSIKEEFDGQLNSFKTLRDNLATERGIIGKTIDRQKAKQIGAIKEVSDAELSSVSAIRKRITELQKLPGSATDGSEIDKRIKALQERLKKGAKATTDTELNERKRLQAEIDEMIAGSTKKQLSSDDAEVQSVTDKYKKMREKAIEFNNSEKAKKSGLRVDVGGLTLAETSEKQVVIDKQSNARFKTLLAEQAKDFEEFENYKIKFGAEAAEKRFGKEFTTGEAYSRKLEDLQTKLLSEIADPAQATESQKQELAVITDAIKQDTDRRKAMQDANYAEARQAAMTNAEEMLKIEQDYQKNLLALGENATEEQKANLLKAKKNAISALATDGLMDSDAWKNLFSDLDNLTITQIDTLIKEIESKFADLKVKFNPIDLTSIRTKLQEARDELIKKNPFAAMGSAIKAVFADGADGAKKSSEQINEEWTNLAESTAASFNFIDNAIQSCDILKDAIGEVGTTAITSLSQIAQAGIAVSKAVEVAGAASSAVAAATTTAIKTAEKASVVLAVISAALVVVQAISGLFKSIFNAHDKRIEKSIEKHKEQVESLGSAYNRLERDVNNAVGKAVEQAHLRQIDNLKQQQAELEKIREAESRKKKPDQGKINETNEQIASIGDKIQDVQKAMVEALTGTTAKSISDGIISGFKNGKRAAADFADDFNGLMEDALLNALKTNFLDVEIANFYKRFAEASKDGLTKEEAERLRNEYTGIINEGLKLVEDIDKITGGPKKDPVVNPDDSKSSEGRLRAALTEETGSKLEGLWRGQFDMTKQLVMLSTERNTLLTPIGKTIGELYSIAKGNFDVAVKTEANTRRTADNTEGVGKKLDQIITNTKPPSTTRVLGI